MAQNFPANGFPETSFSDLELIGSIYYASSSSSLFLFVSSQLKLASIKLYFSGFLQIKALFYLLIQIKRV